MDVDRSKLLPRSGVGVIEPWLVIAPPGNPVIRLYLRALDHVEVIGGEGEGWSLVLECGDLEVALYIADGEQAALELARQANLLTRDATGPTPLDPSKILLVGNDVVWLRGEYIQAGQVAFRVDEVREYALRGQNVPLTGGRLLQAAMALIVVAAEEREAEEREAGRG